MCQVVEPWNYWPLPPPTRWSIYPTIHPARPRHFHRKWPSRSRWESESLVWFVRSGYPQTIGGRPSLTGLLCDRHGAGLLHQEEAQTWNRRDRGVPSWCHHHQTSPAATHLPLRVNVDWCVTATKRLSPLTPVCQMPELSCSIWLVFPPHRCLAKTFTLKQPVYSFLLTIISCLQSNS